MFSFESLKSVHIEITNRCQAQCPMCSRNHHGGLENPYIKNKDWTFENFKTIFTNEVLEQIDKIIFCGNFGDPLINADFLKMCDYVKSHKIYIDIHTNASFYNNSWWNELVTHLPVEHRVVFAIDGLQDTHSKYRVGTDFDRIIRNAQAFIAAGGTAEWSFIKFKHNAHQVDQAKLLANEYGFKFFSVKNSSRFALENKFSVLDKTGKHLYYLEPAVPLEPFDVSKIQQYVDASEITCFAKHQHEVYIDANLDLFPCCFLASIPYNYHDNNDQLYNAKNTIKRQYHQLIHDLGDTNLRRHSIKQIVNSEPYQSVWNKYWNIEKLYTCARTCGQLLMKPSEQFQ